MRTGTPFRARGDPSPALVNTLSKHYVLSIFKLLTMFTIMDHQI